MVDGMLLLNEPAAVSSTPAMARRRLVAIIVVALSVILNGTVIVTIHIAKPSPPEEVSLVSPKNPAQ